MNVKVLLLDATTKRITLPKPIWEGNAFLKPSFYLQALYGGPELKRIIAKYQTDKGYPEYRQITSDTLVGYLKMLLKEASE